MREWNQAAGPFFLCGLEIYPSLPIHLSAVSFLAPYLQQNPPFFKEFFHKIPVAKTQLLGLYYTSQEVFWRTAYGTDDTAC